MTDKPTQVPCELCGRSTRSTGTKRCDRCYELESRIQSDPVLASKILAPLREPEFHQAIAPLLSKRDQGRVMGAWRRVLGGLHA